MITIKDQAGFDRMAMAAKAVMAVHDRVRAALAPGVSLRELDAIAAEVIRAHDCTPSFLGYHGYPASICTSPNSTIVHGIPDNYRLREGDLISIDAGAIYEGFHADAAFTAGVGELDEEAARLIEVTERALLAGIAAVRPGARTGDIGHAVQQVVEAAGFSVVREYVGHGIGRAMHEEPQIPNYGRPHSGVRLKPGMAICIEPMVNVGDFGTTLQDDGWTVVTADGSRSAHFEHTVAITDQGAWVLTG